MKKHNVRRLLVLVLVVALCLLCGAAAQPNPKEIHIYSAGRSRAAEQKLQARYILAGQDGLSGQ